ncbi:MAG TPA: kelch repeat-containing protein [Kofleriaceae bacterium]
MRTAVISLSLALAACGGSHDCDSGWTANGFTSCDTGCGNSSLAMSPSGPACTAKVDDGTTVQCANTFTTDGKQACCTQNKPDVQYAECKPDPWSVGTEITSADVVSPRLEPGVTALGQRVVVLDGFDTNVQHGQHITDDVVAYDPETMTWSQLPATPVMWTHANLAASGATLYLLGGADGVDFEPNGAAWALDTAQANPQWRALSPQPVGLERDAAGIIVKQPGIILVGGANLTTAVDTVLRYDIASDTWTQLPSLPAPRSHPAVMETSDGTLICAGGLSSLDTRDAVDTVFVLPVDATAWETKSPMPLAHGGCAYGNLFDSLVCAGGEAGQAALKEVYRYDWRTDTWSQLPDMPETRAGTQGAVIGGRLFVPGGARTLNFQPEPSLFVLSYLDAISLQ